MSFILDTCVISEFSRPVPDAHVIAWLDQCPEELLFLSALTLGEIQFGIQVLPEGKKRNDIELWFHELRTEYERSILPVTARICLRWGDERARLKKIGISVPVIDGLLACTAIETGYTLVSRNIEHYEQFGIKKLNPWESEKDKCRS